ncbi:helicase HerA-like domain-containing protein [Tundrisphaera sp. TA3]|uniref:helicase HerA-like domain-containing protein n=1 Tax=Tundrisphaera sp. TA3 TaxID=3435775 RepID=UPI003EB781F9
MPPVSFTVSEVRVAATCPRILYFDAEHARRDGLKARPVTRIWKAGDGEATACGSLFHHAVERFNRLAADAAEVRAALAGSPDPPEIMRGLLAFLNGRCVDLDALAAKPVPQRLAFIEALQVYVKELADIVADALRRGKPADEVIGQMFGDKRRRVDVTFPVGPEGEPVHVCGILDYVFFDWRAGGHRIIDYKLTPAREPTGDLFQVGLYALMHNLQHRTEAGVGVLYLHPRRLMAEMAWGQVHESRHKVFDLLASMAAWVRYDEASGSGLKPPGEPNACGHCKWDRGGQCARRLGPKHEGRRLHHWADADAGAAEPKVVVRAGDGGDAGLADLVVHVVATAAPARDPASRPSPVPSPEPPGMTPEVAAPAADALRIGSIGDQPVGLPLSALPTHVAVVGAAGSGKTWMAKVVAEEAVRQGVPVLAIDPQGDLVQFLRPSARVDGLTEAEEAQRREFLARVEPRAWTPGTSHARRLGLEPIRLPGRAEWARVDEEGRDGLLVGAAAHLVGLAAMGGEVDSQQTFVLQILRALMDRASDAGVGLDAIAAAIADPEGFGVDAPDRFIRKSERERLVRKLNGLRFGPSSSLYTGGTPLDLDAMRRPDVPGKTPLNVIYLNALGDDARKQAFVASLAAEIYRWMVSSLDAGAGRPNLLVYLDEARDYIPAGAARPPAKDPLIRLFAQGRKYGVACLLCTQSPRSVDYNVFGNCSTKLIGRLEAAQDVDRVAEWFGREGPTPPWLAGRKGAEAGSFVGRWPGMTPQLEGRPFRSRPLFSLHEGAWSPDRLAREASATPDGPPPTA